MKAADVMVSNVITVSPEASLLDAAEMLVTHRISGLPVVGKDGKLVGIISEGDLIRSIGIDTARRPSGWLGLLIGTEPPAAEFVKSHARKVADVMTREVIVAGPDTPLCDIAALLEKNAIKRVPIVRDCKLIGIVSRSNLVQALATARKPVKVATATSDLMIREDVASRLDAKSWTNGSRINIVVHDGTVELWGLVHSEAEKSAIRVAAELTPGVRDVRDNLVLQSAMRGATI
jgi:CBS domain-containing protein